MAKRKIEVQGVVINIHDQDSDFVSLTDIASNFGEASAIVSNYMRSGRNLEFLSAWELLHNPDFKPIEAEGFIRQSVGGAFTMSPKKWKTATNAMGITSKAGRYGGGTFAHKDIATGFCYWLSPKFQLFFVKEFNRLRDEAASKSSIEWSVSRLISKANYEIHTEAVRKHLIPPEIIYSKKEGMVFANEADLLNKALFGQSAKEWKLNNTDKSGNMRDHATMEQLIVLANLENLNAKLIEWECDLPQRLEILNKTAIDQMEVLLNSKATKMLKQLDNKSKSIKGLQEASKKVKK